MTGYVKCINKYYFLTEVTDFFALLFLNAHLAGLPLGRAPHIWLGIKRNQRDLNYELRFCFISESLPEMFSETFWCWLAVKVAAM